MLNISCVDRKANEEVLRRDETRSEGEQVISIRRRQLKFLGHKLRRRELESGGRKGERPAKKQIYGQFDYNRREYNKR